MDATNKMNTEALEQKKQPTPADFVKEPSTNLLRTKIENWKNEVLISGTLK